MKNYMIFQTIMVIFSLFAYYTKTISFYECIQMQLLTAIITHLIRIDNKLK